jgi:hypothetical protein
MSYRTYALRGPALADHMRTVLARSAPPPATCRHCGAASSCGCGQDDARSAVVLARSLPLPEGSALADLEARTMREAIPAGPLTRAGVEGVARAAEVLAAFWRLGRHDNEVSSCEAVARMARAAAARMP